MIALLSSMPFESDMILSGLKNTGSVKVAGKTGYRGKLSGRGVVLLNTGIGKVNAAHSATCLIEHFPVKNVINLGVGGAYPGSGIGIGDVAIASKEIYGDEGVFTSGGVESLKRIGIPLVSIGKKKYFNEFPLNPPRPLPTGQAGPFTKGGNKDLNVKYGNFVTVSATTGTNKRAIELEKRFNAVCENMEGAAVAQVCAIYKIPMLEIRGISNITGVRDKRKWDLKLAAENCQKMVLTIIKS
jgi:futalosine hydrolase